MTVEITEKERQLTILGLARLSVERPGFHEACKLIADKLGGSEMYEKLRTPKILEGGAPP